MDQFRRRPDRRNWISPDCRPCERVIQLDNYYRSKADDPSAWRVRIMRNNHSEQITREWVDAQLVRQGFSCALSGRPITILDCEVDHIIPRTRGGSDDLSNLRLVCTRANEAKGNMTDDEFLALCREIIGRAIMSTQR